MGKRGGRGGDDPRWSAGACAEDRGRRRMRRTARGAEGMRSTPWGDHVTQIRPSDWLTTNAAHAQKKYPKIIEIKDIIYIYN